jgi:hypothetical protein
MNRATTLILLAVSIGGCRVDAPARPEDDASDVEVASAAEEDPLATAFTGPEEPGGEPGVPGSPAPEAMYRAGDGRCYVYSRWVVTVRPRAAGAGGEDIVVAARAPGADARALCSTPPTEPAASFTDPSSPDAFFGLANDLILVDSGVGPTGRTLRVVDLTSGATVLESPYEEPVGIDDGTLEFGQPTGIHETIEAVQATGVNCPNAAEWLEDGFAVAVNRQVRFHLAERRREVLDDLVCAPAN